MTFQEKLQLASVIIAAAGMAGGFVTVYLKLKEAGAKRMNQLLDSLDKSMRDIKQHSDLQMQRLNGMLSYLINSFDSPAWLKVATTRRDGGTEFRMLEMNAKYVELCQIPKQEYLNHTDLEAGWSHAEAEAFRNTDLLVWATGEASTVTEVINGVPHRFRRIRVESTSGDLKGIFAYEIPCPFDDQMPPNCPANKRDLK